MLKIELFEKLLKKIKHLYFLPKKIRLKIYNIKILKKYKTKTGDYYLPFFAFKDGIRNNIINNKITDEKVFKKLESLITPDSIVLDLGANFGQMSILWSKCKPGVEVYAFEASRFIFEILNKNVKLNTDKVKTLNVLIGNETNKQISIKKSQLNENTTYGTNKIETIDINRHNQVDADKIDTMKIDDISFDKNISAMKIDVQGYDLEALKGAEKTINKYKMPIIFEYEEKFEKEFNYTFKNFEDFINKINYKIDTKIDNVNYLVLPK